MWECSALCCWASICIFSQKRSIYLETGTIIIPATNFDVLLTEFLAENSYVIIKKYTEDACNRVGLSFKQVYDHEDIENVTCTWCNFRTTLEPKQEKIMFFAQFYREMVSYQLYNNGSIERINDFKAQLYREMLTKYSDLFLETPTFEQITEHFEVVHFSDNYMIHVKLAMQQWVSLINNLGANILLPFPPVTVIPENSLYIINKSVSFFPKNNLTLEVFQA